MGTQTEFNDRTFEFFVTAAIIATRKRTPKAIKRCRKRMARTIQSIDDRAENEAAFGALAAGAKCILARSCRVCGLCKGR